MIKTCVFFRPGSRDADLIRIGALYLSRAERSVYSSFIPEVDGMNAAVATAAGQPMELLLSSFYDHFYNALKTVDFSTLLGEEAIVESVFRLLPTNLKHDSVEGYPPEDFLRRAFRDAVVELDEEQLTTA